MPPGFRIPLTALGFPTVRRVHRWNGMRTSWFVLASALFVSSSAIAQPWDPVGRTDADGNPGVARIPDGLGVPTVDDPWGERVTRRVYDSGTGGFWRIAEYTWLFAEWLDTDFDDALARKIADGCRRKYPGDSWRQIHCGSVAVEMLLDHHDLEKGFRSPCRSHPRAFKEVIEALDIPGTLTAPNVIPFHVLNRLFVTTMDGDVFQYAIDVGWSPEVLYPNNDSARRWHDPDGDGITDVSSLPPLPVHGGRIDYSFRPAPSRTGSNVPRNAATRGGVPATRGASSSGGASGAGMQR